jgi:hypothetical protein
MSRIGTFMAASIGSGVLVAFLAVFIGPRAGAIAFLILIPACAAILFFSRRSGVVEPSQVQRHQLWYRASGIVLILGSVVLLFIKNARAVDSGKSLGAGPLADFAIGLGLGVFLLVPLRKTR